MINSYRLQAERRASLSRAPVSAGRGAVKPMLALPPWGYGSGRPSSSTPPAIAINSTRRPTRARPRSQSPAKETTPAHSVTPFSKFTHPAFGRHATGPSKWFGRLAGESSGPSTYGLEGAGLSVVAEKNVESDAEKCASSEISEASGVPTQHPCSWRGAACGRVGDTALTGPSLVVASSSMETWTTTSPRAPSGVSSPHSIDTTSLDRPGGSSSPLSSRLHQLLQTATANDTPPHAMVATFMASTSAEAASALTTAGSLSPDLTSSQKGSASTKQPTTNEPSTAVGQQVGLASSPLCSGDRLHEQKTIASSANALSTTGGVAIDTPIISNSGDDSKGVDLHHVAFTSQPGKFSTTTPVSNEQNKPTLMVGLLKVKSPRSGLMMDCPILETLYQDDAMDKSPATAARKSSSHKVVLIKAVVPRWTWNGRRQFTSDSSSITSLSSTNSKDRGGAKRKASKRKTLVSANTQTSDTLLPLRISTSGEQSAPKSPITVTNTFKHARALKDDGQSTSSPNVSICFAPCNPVSGTSAECGLRSPVTSPNNKSCLSSAFAENGNLIPAESSDKPTLLCHSNVQTTISEKPKESEAKQRSALMDYDSMMEDRPMGESLKLDLPFSSSENNSESEILHKTTPAKHRKLSMSSSCSDDMPCDRQLPSSCSQGLSTLQWSAAATALSDALENFKTSGFIGLSPSSSRQKPGSAGRKALTPEGRSTANHKTSSIDSNQHPRNHKRNSSTKTSQKNNAKIRPSSDTCSPLKSACLWRLLSRSNDEMQESWQEYDLSHRDPLQYEQQQNRQRPPSQQQILTTTQNASRSESSLCMSGPSKSTVNDYHEVTMSATSPRMSSINPNVGQSSTLPLGQWVHYEQDVNGIGYDMDAIEPFDVNVHFPAHGRPNNFQSHAAGEVESANRQSRQHNHRRPTLVNTRLVVEPKPLTQQQYKMTRTDAKRSGDRQGKWSTQEATRRDEVVLQSSPSTGSVDATRNADFAATTAKRQHPSSTGRHVSHLDKQRSPAGDVSGERRASSSRRENWSAHGNQRKTNVRSERYSASNALSGRSDRHANTSSGRYQHRGSRTIDASASRSADSMSSRRGRPQTVHANYSTFVADQSNSSRTKRADSRQPRCRDEDQSPATFFECPQPVVYCSPRSLKPFPPPISDRIPSSVGRSAGAVVGTSTDVESMQFVHAQNQDDTISSDDQPRARDNYPSPPPRRNELLFRAERAGTEEPDHPRPRRGANKAAVGGGTGGQRRKQLTATPAVDGRGWCAEPEASVRTTGPSLSKRPAWKKY